MSTDHMVYRCCDSQERHDSVGTGCNNALLTERRDRARSASIMSVCPHGQQDLPRSRHKEMVCRHPSCAAGKRTYYLPARNRYSTGVGQLPYDTHRTKKYTLSWEQEKIFPKQRDTPSTGCKCSLSLCKEMFQAQRARSRM